MNLILHYMRNLRQCAIYVYILSFMKKTEPISAYLKQADAEIPHRFLKKFYNKKLISFSRLSALKSNFLQACGKFLRRERFRLK